MSLRLLVVLLWLVPLFALEPGRKLSQYVVGNWNITDGLPQNSVQTICQTSDGYLWFGTLDGFARFDGIRFKVFNRDNTPYLKRPSITTLVADGGGVLWIATENGLLRHKDESIVRFDVSSGLSGNWITALALDGQGGLYIGNSEGGLDHWVEGKISHLIAPAGLGGTGPIYGIVRESDGKLWLGGEQGLFTYDGKIKKIGASEGYKLKAIFLLQRTPSGLLCIGTNSGLVIVEGGQFRLVDKTSGLLDNAVYSVCEDRDESLWVGTGTGLNRIRNGKVENEWVHPSRDRDPLTAIIEDREGNLWLGRQNTGLFRLRDGKFTTLSSREGLKNDIVWSAMEDKQGRIWVGTDQGINIIRDGKLERVIDIASGLGSNLVLPMLLAQDGAAWVGTYGGGLVRMEGDKLQRFNRASGLLPDDRVRSLAEDGKGRLWIGLESALVLLDGGRFINLIGGTHGISPRTILPLADGDILVGHNDGAIRIAGTEPNRRQPVPALEGKMVLSLLQRGEDLYFGTYGHGLILQRRGKNYEITPKQGLFDDRVFHLLAGQDEALWMCSNRGIFRVSFAEIERLVAGETATLLCENYDTDDGLKSVECNGGASPGAGISRDGSLLFPTVKGIVQIQTGKMTINKLPPPVRIEGLWLNGDWRESIDGQQIFSRDRVGFAFTGLSLVDAKKVAFRYRLVGFDEQWVEERDKRIAFYNHLEPGDYRFEVLAANNDGVWSEKPATISLRVIRPWSQSPQLVLWLSAAALAALIFLLWRYATRLKSEREQILTAVEIGNRELHQLRDKLEARQRSMLELANRASMAELGMSVLQQVAGSLNGIFKAVVGLEKLAREGGGGARLRGLKVLSEGKDRDAMDQTFGAEKGPAYVAELERLSQELAANQEQLLTETVNLRDQIHQVAEIVEAQQEYAKISGSEDRVDINMLIEDVLRLRGEFLRQNRVEVFEDLLPVPLIGIHKSLLLQIAAEMVRFGCNSIMDNEENKPRLLFMRSKYIENEAVLIEVQDTGRGADAQELAGLNQAKGSSASDSYQVGLARQIAKELGASLEIKSEGHGRGYLQRLVLPYEEALEENEPQ